MASQAVMVLQRALGRRLVAVVLFGSRARGEASQTSDWDLLIIAEGIPDRPFQRHLFLKRLLPPRCRAAVSMLARTKLEFESHIPSLYLDIALDGQVLYDPSGYAAGRLAVLRRLMNETGLYRVRVEAGMAWRWSKPVSHPWFLAWEN